MDSVSSDMEEVGILDMGKMKKHITWDEKTIAEHDKERGTRMVVNEPKTPFNRLGLPENPEEVLRDEREELIKRLNSLHQTFNNPPANHVGFADPSVEKEEDEEDKEKEEKHRAFLLKRKLHYNEYQVVKKMREQLEEEEENEEKNE